nr:hypothetical protein [Ureaplasma parvum]
MFWFSASTNVTRYFCLSSNARSFDCNWISKIAPLLVIFIGCFHCISVLLGGVQNLKVNPLLISKSFVSPLYLGSSGYVVCISAWSKTYSRFDFKLWIQEWYTRSTESISWSSEVYNSLLLSRQYIVTCLIVLGSSLALFR